jgi:hypothetical protein
VWQLLAALSAPAQRARSEAELVKTTRARAGVEWVFEDQKVALSTARLA